MKYIGIAIIDDSKFRNAEVEAENGTQAEQKLLHQLQDKYIGQINIIKVVEKDEWCKLVEQTRKRNG